MHIDKIGSSFSHLLLKQEEHGSVVGRMTPPPQRQDVNILNTGTYEYAILWGKGELKL